MRLKMKRIIASILLCSVFFGAIAKPKNRKQKAKKNQIQLKIKNTNSSSVYVTLSSYNWIKARWSKPRVREIKPNGTIRWSLPKKTRSARTLYWDTKPVTTQDIQNQNFQGSSDVDMLINENKTMLTIPKLRADASHSDDMAPARSVSAPAATATPITKPKIIEGDVTETTIGQTKEVSAPSAGQQTIVPLVKVNPQAPAGVQALIQQVNQAITTASQPAAQTQTQANTSNFNLTVTNSSDMKLYITFRETQWSNNSTTEITRNINAGSAMQLQIPKKTQSNRILYWNDQPLTNLDIQLKKFMGSYNIGNDIAENEKSIIISK